LTPPLRDAAKVAKSQTPLVGVAVPAPWGMLAMLGQIIVTLTSAGSISQVHIKFTCRDVREALDLSQWRTTNEGTSFSKWGKQVTEKSHEADESDNSCYCSLDVCVCGAALL
jgi:hypothetical protein